MTRPNPEARRGFFFTTGEPILSTPTEAQLKNLSRDPRLEYFSLFGEEPVSEDSQIRLYHPVGEIARLALISRSVTPLVERIRMHLMENLPADALVWIRGTACSLDGSIKYKDTTRVGDQIHEFGKEIRSIEQILSEGTDTGALETGVWPGRINDNVHGLFGLALDHIYFYVRKFRKELRRQGISDGSVFPLVLVYDATYIDPTWALRARLPEDVESRSKAILRAYILDYPHE